MHKLFGLHVPTVDAVRWVPTHRDGELRNVFTGLRMREYAPAKPTGYVCHIYQDPTSQHTYWYDSPDSGFAIEYAHLEDALAAAIIEVARGPISGIMYQGDTLRLADVFTMVYDFTHSHTGEPDADLVHMVRAQALTIIERWLK